ncbi:hypothetical protein D3C84_932650 [compost metagenome]
MVALVQLPARSGGQGIDRVELHQPDTRLTQSVEECRRRGEGADAVVDQVDLHATALLGDQGVGEALPDLVVVEDVGFHVDVVTRAFDGREHRRVGLGAVLQQVDLVAVGERAAHQGLFDRQMQVEDVGLHAGGLEPVQDRLAARFGKRALGAIQLHRGGR